MKKFKEMFEKMAVANISFKIKTINGDESEGTHCEIFETTKDSWIVLSKNNLSTRKLIRYENIESIETTESKL